MSERKVFVTGATGLVGSHILVDLAKESNCEIYAAKRAGSNLGLIQQLFDHYGMTNAYSKVNWIDFDLNNIASLPSVNEIIHTAAVVSFNPKDYDAMTQTNVNATKQLLQRAKENGIKKFGFISSIASLGRTKESNNYTENSPWSESTSNSFYSKTKYASEQEVIKSNGDTMKTFVVNPGVILGPCDWNKSSGTIFKTAIKGLKFYTKGVNGFVDVRDVSSALLRVMEVGIPAEKHIVVGQNIGYREVFTTIAQQTNSPIPTIAANKLMTEFGWRIAKLKGMIKGESPALTKESARTAHGLNYYDNSKLPALGQFKYHTIENAIANGVDFLKTNNYF